jgi:hypothetical protein
MESAAEKNISESFVSRFSRTNVMGIKMKSQRIEGPSNFFIFVVI